MSTKSVGHGRSVEHARLLVRTILANASAYRWSLQGFGMFRLYLSTRTRLHVWDPEFAVPGVSTIHTHPWHFLSTVVAGRMVDRLYGRVENADPTHHIQRIVCGPGGCAVGEPGRTTLRLLQEVAIGEGKAYGLTADALHESRPEPGTITIIDREFREDNEHAYVCFPLGTSWVSAEPRDATRDEIMSMAARAIGKLGVTP